MSNQPSERTVPPWLYKLFTGHQYPYVRRQAKFAQRDFPPGSERGEPTKEEIESKFWEIYPRCWIKVLEEVKTGMIVVFHELGTCLRASIKSTVPVPHISPISRAGTFIEKAADSSQGIGWATSTSPFSKVC